MVKEKILKIIGNFNSKSLVVIGDYMLDKNTIGEVSRISPEAPVQIVKVREYAYSPGGAGNCAANVVSLGGKVYCVGVVGDDTNGRKLIRVLQKTGCESKLIPAEGKSTIVKERIFGASHGHYQHLLRLDHGEYELEDVDEGLENMIAETCMELINNDVWGIILSDYRKGNLTVGLCKKVISLAQERDIPVIVDPKPKDVERFYGATVIAPNHEEAAKICGMDYDKNGLDKMAKRMADILNLKYVIITCGKDGMFAYDVKKNEGKLIPTRAKEVHDVTGAGDTAVAALSLALVSGADIFAAAEIANYAAGIAVSKRGTVAVKIEELKDILMED